MTNYYMHELTVCCTRRLSENRNRREGEAFWVSFFVHLRRIVALFNENERKKWTKWFSRTSAWMHVGRAMQEQLPSRFSIFGQPPSITMYQIWGHTDKFLQKFNSIHLKKIAVIEYRALCESSFIWLAWYLPCVNCSRRQGNKNKPKYVLN